jgi:hypothetical protein
LIGFRKVDGAELTNLLDMSASEAESFTVENIPGSNERTEGLSEDSIGKKLSKNSCGGIGPTKKEDISSDSRLKVASLSSYFGANRSVVELQVWTGVPAGSSTVLWGGV